ncbi:hypothetical protein VNI00_016054 [Paramarasmius palmivorus]|uniref:Uncharacterized protein n=1 Tax=Paramarasmius palmivorus TaxID=297713 RepID=A0AAW0BGE9_9AGAR
MSHIHGSNDVDSDSDTAYGWNISKLCEAANHLRLAPEYTPYCCEPEVHSDIALPLPLYEPEYNWYLFLTPTPQPSLKPGIYRDFRCRVSLASLDQTLTPLSAIKSQFTNVSAQEGDCIFRGADTLEDARRIWRKQCIRHHREDPRHLAGQEALDDAAYSAASQAKAALVYEEIVSAYPQFRPRRRRRDHHNDQSSSVSANLGECSVQAPTSNADSTTRVTRSQSALSGWHIYLVHANGQRRHRSLEYALASLHSQGSTAPARLVLARTNDRARGVFEAETGIRQENVAANTL